MAKKKKKKSTQDEPNVYFSMLKNDRAKIFVQESEYKGKQYFQIVEKWRTEQEAEDGIDDWKFSKKIISLPLDSMGGKKPIAEKFIRMFRKAFKPSKKGQ